MSLGRLDLPRARRLIAVLHLAGAGALLLGPAAVPRALALLPRLPALAFRLETGRDGAACALLAVLLGLGWGTWRRAVAGRLRVGFRVAFESTAVAAVCSLIAAASVVTGVLSRYPLWPFAVWLAALGMRFGLDRPTYPQALAAHRLTVILGLLLVCWGFRALLAAEKLDGLMAGALGVMAIADGLLILSISAPLLVLLDIVKEAGA